MRLAGLIEIAGTSFLDLMEHLRKVIMQNKSELASQFQELRADLGKGLTDMGATLSGAVYFHINHS